MPQLLRPHPRRERRRRGELTEAGTLFNQIVRRHLTYLNDAFNLAAEKLAYPGVPCLNGVNLEPQFTAPNPVNAGEIVGFDGMESDITLDAGTHFNAKGAAETTYADLHMELRRRLARKSAASPRARRR